MDTRLSVIVCTHRPDPGRLYRTLDGLKRQSLPPGAWGLIVVDNASPEPVTLPAELTANLDARLIVEPSLGLTAARIAGLRAAQGDLIVFVDDDNVLDPDYLEQAARLMAAHPDVGVAGGRVVPEFETAPQEWQKEFFGLLALREGGDLPSIVLTLRPEGSRQNTYPKNGPLGAGLVARRAALDAWLRSGHHHLISGRRGAVLSSGEDNDIVLCAMKEGWACAYFPALKITHLIPAARLEPRYLARLNRGIQKSWMQVLARHDAGPWAAVAPWTVPLRKIKAWFTYRAWSSPAARIRWQGACGHFEGRVSH